MTISFVMTNLLKPFPIILLTTLKIGTMTNFMAIYKPYPKYKNSNIPWLGEIPEHWEITKLKYLITLQKGKVPKEFSNKENNLPYLSMEYLRGKLTIPSYVLPQENLIEVENDELLILWDGANAGEVMKSKKGVLSS